MEGRVEVTGMNGRGDGGENEEGNRGVGGGESDTDRWQREREREWVDRESVRDKRQRTEGRRKRRGHGVDGESDRESYRESVGGLQGLGGQPAQASNR